MSAAGENPIQERVVEQLQKNLYFTAPKAIPLLTVDAGDLQDLILQKVNVVGGGVAVTVLTPFGENPEPNSGAVNLDLQLEISASEIHLVNRAASGINKPAYAVIRQIMRPYRPDNQGGLHFWKPGPPFTRLELQDFDEIGVKVKGASILTYRAIFGVREMLS